MNTKIIVKFIFISLVTINMDCGNYAYPPGNDHISPIKGRPIEEEIVLAKDDARRPLTLATARRPVPIFLPA
ncbi:hypothetical protein CMK14_23745 [Candidatus Poribacteria bacterium]|nr:hypothetical protein [Candidatus Poribacteria bacterium]